MASGDLTDLATAKLAANVTTSGSDTVLASLITAMSAYVPQVINRNILADNYLELYTGNGKDRMLLRQRPVLQITSISWTGQSVIVQADPINGPNGFFTDGRNACLYGYCFPRDVPVRIAYSAGFIAVPADVNLAVAELVAEAYSRRLHIGQSSNSANGQVTQAFDMRAMHAAIADKLKNYRHGAPC